MMAVADRPIGRDWKKLLVTSVIDFLGLFVDGSNEDRPPGILSAFVTAMDISSLISAKGKGAVTCGNQKIQWISL